MKVQLGRINHLRIARFTAHGAVLDADGIDILMPKKYTSRDQHPGDEVDVFVYLDQDERLVATTETPLAMVGDIAVLRVAWTNEYGAFMDWGVNKNLFVPFSEQVVRFQQGREYLVYIGVDPVTGRIVGTSKLGRYLQDVDGRWKAGDDVKVVVWRRTDLGYKVVVENVCEGLVYANEVFRPLQLGQRLTATVKHVRPDGKLDISLQHSGSQGRGEAASAVLKRLVEAGGFLPYNDDSDAEEIKEALHMSKKAFKRAIGNLYRQQRIELLPDGIALKAEGE